MGGDGEGKPTFLPWVDFQPTLAPLRGIFGGGEGYAVANMGNVPLLMRNSFTAAGSAPLAILLGTSPAYASTLTLDKAKTLPVQIAGNVTTTGPRYWDIAAQGLVASVSEKSLST